MFSNTIKRLFFPLLIVAIFLSSCATTGHSKPEKMIASVDTLRAKMKDVHESLDSLRYPDAVLEYYGGSQRVKLRQLILVEDPDKIRIQTRVPASEEIMSLLVSADGHFAMHDRRTNTYYSGPATAENISRLLPVELTPKDFVNVMYGGAPWDKFDHFSDGAGDLTWDNKKGLYVLSKNDTDGDVMKMFVDPDTYATTEVEVDKPNGVLMWHYTTDEWSNDDGAYLPGFRRFTMPSKDVDFSIETSKVELNPEFNDLLFELEPPAGSKMVTFK